MGKARAIVAVTALAGLASAVWLVNRAITPAPVAAAIPCASINTPVDARRYGAQIFEGIVVDRWPHTTRIQDRVVTIQHYRFYVLRSWSKQERPMVALTQGWSTGTPYLRGAYRVFERGGRYLVFAVSHDMPPSTFSTSCMPGAEGAGIAAMAASLGPPVTSFPEADLPPVPFWMPMARSALDWVRVLTIAMDRTTSPSPAPAR